MKHAKGTQRKEKCAPCVHLRPHLAFRVYGLGERNLDEDMVNVGVRRQSRSPPNIAMSSLIQQAKPQPPTTVTSLLGQCGSSQAKPRPSQHCQVIFDLVWEFAGKAAAPPTL